MWARRRRVTGSVKAGGVAGVEAFLLGDSANFYRARGEPVPTWAWLNAVAHAEPEVVLALSRTGASAAGRSELDRRGAQAVSSIARAVARHAGGDPTAIRALQQDLLVPLELALIARRMRAVDAQAVGYLTLVALRAGHCPPTATGAADGHDQPP